MNRPGLRVEERDTCCSIHADGSGSTTSDGSQMLGGVPAPPAGVAQAPSSLGWWRESSVLCAETPPTSMEREGERLPENKLHSHFLPCFSF